jgi:hypothetical protein
MIDYNKTIIYKIVHKENVDSEVYIGHTTDFRKRKNQHKTTCNNNTGNNNHSHYKVYEYIRNNGGWDAFIMNEVEIYPCSCKNEARQREQYWSDIYNSSLNNRKAHSTPDEIKEYYLSYSQINKEKRRKWEQQYNKKRAGYFKEWYENNKNNIKEKITCSCGCILNKGNLSRHLKSKQHLNPANIT